jgi:coenzyme F420-reducing hydrogenase alpha subunit
MSTKTIKVGYLARVEGEGGLRVTVKAGPAGPTVSDVSLDIFEPPRFFEAFLQGRHFTEAPDITARICGICPIAYQMSAVHAMEDACGVRLTGPLRALRRLIYCGEWIESHALHIYMLHAPDFLGYPDVIQMAKDHPEEVNRGLELKKIGNEIVSLIGGREIHPINVKVGGFYRAPPRRELAALREHLEVARQHTLDTITWVSRFTFPNFEHDYQYVALAHPDEYPFNEGLVTSSGGLSIAVQAYEDHFEERHEARSTALHSEMVGVGPYLVGPLARFSLNFDKLSSTARQAAKDAGLGGVCRNPFKSIVVRAVETLHACEEALRIVEEYVAPDEPAIEVLPRAGRGCALTEAPRGSLYHRYEIDDEGLIVSAKIVPPTSQNQGVIERDLLGVVSRNIELPTDELRLLCEHTVRNYDPCISCSTHFLKLDIEKEA